MQIIKQTLRQASLDRPLTDLRLTRDVRDKDKEHFVKDGGTDIVTP